MVRYDVFLHDGKHLKISYACFGLLNDLPMGRYNVYNIMYPDQEQRQIAESFASEVRPENMSFVQYYPKEHFYASAWSCPQGNPSRELIRQDGESEQDAKDRALKTYFEEMKLLLEDFPMLKGAVTLHPLAKCVRVHIKENEADKVILSLFLFRNLAQDEYIHGYRYLRNRGYRPRLAAIIAHTIIFAPRSHFSPERWYSAGQDENSWVNTMTFGKQAFINLAKQEEGFSPWYQQPFKDQEHGYMRDSHFEREEEVFNESCDSYEDDSSYYRRLTDAFSIVGDEKLHPNQRFSSCSGFYWGNSLPSNPVEDVFGPLIQEAGISRSL